MSDDLRLAVALNGYGLEHDEPDGMWREMLRWEQLAELARAAERHGFESIFTPEIRGWEAFTSLSGMAAVTDGIRLATGVIRLDSRGLETLAMAASSLQERSQGRFALGVGSAGSIRWTGDRIRALRETIRGGVVGGPEVEAPRTDWDMAPQEIPLYLGALGPRMTALAGEVADGVILNWCTPERVAEARRTIDRRGDFTMCVYVRACLSHVDDGSLRALKIATARYLAMEPYARQFDAMGLGGPMRAARAPAGRGAPAEEAVPDELVDAVCVRGTPDRALDRIEQYREAGADVVVVYPVPAGEAVSSITGTLMALASRPAIDP